MQIKINNEQTKFKELVYEESIWTGRRTITYDGVTLAKRKRGVYALQQGEQTEQITVKGNQLFGVKLTIFGQTIELLRQAFWYEILLSVLVFIPSIVFISLGDYGGDVGLSALAGSICGGIGGVLYFASFYLMRRVDKFYLKIILFVEFITVCMLLNYIVAAMIFKTLILI